MVERLIKEHRELAPKLDEIQRVTTEDPRGGLILLEGIRTNILRHAVEEEARIMRVIMKEAKSESTESVRIMQEHWWVSEFLERRTKVIPNLSNSEAQAEIDKFLEDLKEHLREEEEVVFPPALKAQASERS